MLVLASAAFLILGLATSDARPVAVSLVAGCGALLLLWAGIARSAPLRTAGGTAVRFPDQEAGPPRDPA